MLFSHTKALGQKISTGSLSQSSPRSQCYKLPLYCFQPFMCKMKNIFCIFHYIVIQGWLSGIWHFTSTCRVTSLSCSRICFFVFKSFVRTIPSQGNHLQRQIQDFVCTHRTEVTKLTNTWSVGMLRCLKTACVGTPEPLEPPWSVHHCVFSYHIMWLAMI